MEIKTSLKRLAALFAQGASDEEAPIAVRRFSAQLTILTAHVQRVEKKLDALAMVVDEQVAELASHITSLKAAPSAAGTPTPDAPTTEEPLSEEDAAAAMAEQTLRETEAEARALAAAASGGGATVTPLRQPPNGEQGIDTAPDEAS